VRVLFAGSPAIAIPTLKMLAASPCVELAGILTNPDSAKGRKKVLTATEVGEAAAKVCSGVPVIKAAHLDGEARRAVEALKAEALVSFAYGRIFGPKFLSLFKEAVNIHPSLLPKYRGPTPVQAAILNGDREGGVTIQRIALEVDSGDILAQERVALTGRETTAGLEAQAGEMGAVMLEKLLPALQSGRVEARPQDNAGASYCTLITKENGLLDWRQDAVHIDAQIRAYTPWPLCLTHELTHQADKELYILEAEPLAEPLEGSAAPGTVLGTLPAGGKQQGILVQTGRGLLAVKRLQYRTKKALDWKSFLNGAPRFIGSVLE
jgi:methionyl-tRNA formyltransferase